MTAPTTGPSSPAGGATASRRVSANLALTLDGRFHGPGGPSDLGAIVPYAVTETGRRHLASIHEGATTAVLGRGSAEGFLGWWGPVAGDAAADPRDRAYATWLVGVEKVVLSHTLTGSPWPGARVVEAPVTEVITDLLARPGGDVLVNCSPSLIKPLLAADLVDRLYLLVCPRIAGGGERLLDDGLPPSAWSLTHHEVGEQGEMSLVYDRAR